VALAGATATTPSCKGVLPYNRSIPNATAAKDMFSIPDTPPNITCVDFAVVRAGAQRTPDAAPETIRFLYDPEESITGLSLNDPGIDFNQYLHTLAQADDVSSASVSISFDHGMRTVLIVPIKGAWPNLDNIGDLVSAMARMMYDSGAFPHATAENDAIYHLAALAGRAVEAAETPAPRP
jgi:hypothetical protein